MCGGRARGRSAGPPTGALHPGDRCGRSSRPAIVVDAPMPPGAARETDRAPVCSDEVPMMWGRCRWRPTPPRPTLGASVATGPARGPPRRRDRARAPKEDTVDADRFDGLVACLGTRRRAVLGAVAAGVLARLGYAAEEAAAGPVCRRTGDRCRQDAQCCTATCKKRRGRRRAGAGAPPATRPARPAPRWTAAPRTFPSAARPGPAAGSAAATTATRAARPGAATSAAAPPPTRSAAPRPTRRSAAPPARRAARPARPTTATAAPAATSRAAARERGGPGSSPGPLRRDRYPLASCAGVCHLATRACFTLTLSAQLWQ